MNWPTPPSQSYKKVLFPPVMQRAVKCPLCRSSVAGMIVRGSTKWLMPCQHQISPAQEAVIVNDMYRRGL